MDCINLYFEAEIKWTLLLNYIYGIQIGPILLKEKSQPTKFKRELIYVTG